MATNTHSTDTPADAEVWRRYWVYWYERHMKEAEEAKKIAEQYGAVFPSAASEKAPTRSYADGLEDAAKVCDNAASIYRSMKMDDDGNATEAATAAEEHAYCCDLNAKAIRALKKADPQVAAEKSGERSRCDAGAKTGVGQPEPAVSALCVERRIVTGPDEYGSVYVYLTEQMTPANGVHHTKRHSASVDYGPDGKVLGIEILDVTDKRPNDEPSHRPSEDAVLMAQTAIERFGSRRFDKLTLDQADQLRMARQILRLAGLASTDGTTKT